MHNIALSREKRESYEMGYSMIPYRSRDTPGNDPDTAPGSTFVLSRETPTWSSIFISSLCAVQPEITQRKTFTPFETLMRANVARALIIVRNAIHHRRRFRLLRIHRQVFFFFLSLPRVKRLSGDAIFVQSDPSAAISDPRGN